MTWQTQALMMKVTVNILRGEGVLSTFVDQLLDLHQIPSWGSLTRWFGRMFELLSTGLLLRATVQ